MHNTVSPASVLSFMLCNLLEVTKYQFNVKPSLSYQSEIHALNHFATDLSTLFNSVNKDSNIRV